MTKIHMDVHRGYRRRPAPERDEIDFQVVVEQSDLWITADRDLSRETSIVLRSLRGELQTYITLHPDFSQSLVPLAVAPDAPALVQDMAAAASLCNVGPMAAVAGTIAQYTARHFAPEHPDFLVENGGDLYMYSTKERTIGILADPESGVRLGIKLAPDAFPVSLCASSARIGHSLSLGKGDLVVVRSTSGSFADAAATALCNMLKHSSDLDALIKTARTWSKSGLDGVFAQCDGNIAAWGNLELTTV